MTLKRLFQLIKFVLVSLALMSCSVSGNQTGTPILSVASSLVPTATLPPLTNTPNPSPSLTSILPNTTSTPTILSTPMPTLNPEDAQQFVLKLLETNGDCKFPCWWGQIVPGKTKWADANRFLQTFATKVRLAGEKNDLLLYGAYFAVPETIRLEKELIASIDVRDGIVEQIFIGQPYTHVDLLRDYGKPTDIQLHVSGDTFEAFSSEGRFTIAFLWGNKGILAVYEGSIQKADTVEICMTKLDKPEPALWLWDPAKPRTMNEVGGALLYGSPPFQAKFYPLEEVISINNEIFYQTYSNTTTSDACFEILDSFSP